MGEGSDQSNLQMFDVFPCSLRVSSLFVFLSIHFIHSFLSVFGVVIIFVFGGYPNYFRSKANIFSILQSFPQFSLNINSTPSLPPSLPPSLNLPPPIRPPHPHLKPKMTPWQQLFIQGIKPTLLQRLQVHGRPHRRQQRRERRLR